jgi:hypothetical protein
MLDPSSYVPSYLISGDFNILFPIYKHQMILEPLKHVVAILAEIYSLIVVFVLAVLKLEVHLHRLRILNTYQLKVVEVERLEIEVAPRLIDSLLVSLLEEGFSLHLQLS